MTDRLLLAQVSVDIRDLQKKMQQAGFAVETTGRRMAQNWRTSTQSMSRDTEQFGRDVRRAIASIALATVASDVTQLADAWTSASNQISAAAAATGTAGVSLSTIADISRETRSEFEATAALYARLTRATGDLGVSQQQVIEATRLINQAFVAGGASAQEQSSAIIQLSQALSSGVLQGDELRSLRESSPLLLQAIAKEFGVAQGALKALGAEGKLTSDRIFAAILKAAPQIEAQFSVTQSTVADSFQNLRTSAVEYVGTLNSSLGVTDKLGNVIEFLADNFESFADALLITAAVLGARGLGGALNRAGADFAKYASGIGSRRSELIRQLQDQAEATKLQARQAALAVAEEEKNLAALKKSRESAVQDNTGDTRAIVQSRILTQAREELIVAEKRLDDVNKNKNATLDQQTAAANRVAAAQANLNTLEQQRVAGLVQSESLSQKEAAATQRLALAKVDLAQAKRAARNAADALAAAQNRLASAGRSVLSFFGGPLGLAFVAVGAAMAYFQYQTIKAERAVRNVNEALAILAEGYGTSEGLARDAAGASAELTAELKAQKDAVEALAAIERQQRRETYIKAIEAARDRVRELGEEVAYAKGEIFSFDYALKYSGLTEPAKRESFLSQARKDLEDMTRYLSILEAGFAGLDRIDFAKPDVPTDIPVTAGAGPAGDQGEAADRAKAEADAARRAADEAENLIEQIRAAWRGYYEWKDEAINREERETLDAIEKSALSAEDKIAARTMAEQTAAAKRRELLQEEMDAFEEAEKAKADSAARELDLVQQVQDERDRIFGRTLSIIAREYEARRAAINAEIEDAARRNQALAALADEEAEFKRQAAQKLLQLDERSDAGAEIARVQEAQAAKLAALQEGYDLELIQLEEFEETKRAIIEDSEAEIQAIRDASGLTLLAGAESLFGALSQLASTFAGQQSGIFKALFFAEKAFALASAYVQMQLAIAKANASAPPPFNAPAILAAKVTGAAAIAGIIASTAAGFKKGGYTGDGDPNAIAGPVHRGEYVFDAKATKRLGVKNLEAIRSGRMPSTIPAPVPARAGRSVTFGNMILNVSGDGASEIRDELAGMLASHRRQIVGDIDRDFGNTMQRELKTMTPRHERRRG